MDDGLVVETEIDTLKRANSFGLGIESNQSIASGESAALQIQRIRISFNSSDKTSVKQKRRVVRL